MPRRNTPRCLVFHPTELATNLQFVEQYRLGMHLLALPDDVLLNIGSLILRDHDTASYIADFESRRRVFWRLMRVSRRFYDLFTPSLYRTLHIAYETCTWPEEYEDQWLKLSPDRVLVCSLLQTLVDGPLLRQYIYCLDL